MARESAESKTVALAFERQLLKAPDTLTPEQAAIWGRVVASKPSDWFDHGSLPLLESFCRETVEARRLAALLNEFKTEWLADDDGLKRYERLKKLASECHKVICSLSVKLRISPSSSMRAENAITKNGKHNGRHPWSTNVIEHDEG